MYESCSKEILGLLIDKYERTAAYRAGAQPEKRIILNLYGKVKSDYPAYDIEDHTTRTTVNEAVIALSQRGLITFEWCRGEVNHILRRLWLNIDRVGEVYRLLDRTPARERVKEIIDELTVEIEAASADWIVSFYSDSAQHLRESLKRGSLLPETADTRRQLYHLLRVIDSGVFGSVSERVFSEKCFGDSKYFENHLKATLLSILRKYVSRELTDAELLRSVGISRYPEPLELRGSVIVNGSPMGVLSRGFCIYSDEITDMELSIPEITTITTIENRANFFAYQGAERELVVYHGGQYSPAKRQLFIKLAEAMPRGCVWRHWGDIDLGGFSMLLRLRREILPGVQPYRMNADELTRYSDFAQPIRQDYAEKLQALSGNDLLADCRDCLRYMCENRVRLEQEAMLT